MGRNAAGQSFLRGSLTHSRADGVWVHVQKPSHAEGFREAVARFRPGATVAVVEPARLRRLATPRLLFRPDPGLPEAAFPRVQWGGEAGHGASSLCGVTHTTASARAMDAITGVLTAPVQPWDALICTGAAVKDNVTRLLEAEAEYLRQRLGATRLVRPRLPAIALGLHTADFAADAGQRAAARAGAGAL